MHSLTGLKERFFIYRKGIQHEISYSFGELKNMLVGLMADTHDCLPLIRAAVREMNRQEVGLVLHAGDFVSPFVVRELHQLQAPLIGVFGNNDGDHPLLKKRVSEKEGCELRGSFAFTTVQDRTVVVLHGDEPDLMKALLSGSAFDLIVHGHSHQKGIMKKGKTRAVNPGEVCGYLTGTPTIALYETDTAGIEFIELHG
jgi:putative phosphoesterase